MSSPFSNSLGLDLMIARGAEGRAADVVGFIDQTMYANEDNGSEVVWTTDEVLELLRTIRGGLTGGIDLSGRPTGQAEQHHGLRLYVAGPMTGLPEFNYPAFREATRSLSEAGYTVEDPSTNVNDNPDDYHEWLRLGLRQLIECEGVALLPGWESSGGARREVNVAAILGQRVMSVDEWLGQSAGGLIAQAGMR